MEAAPETLRRRERGSAVALLGLVLATMVVAVLLLAGVTTRVVDRASAQSAADAAALAGAADGPDAAATLARLNGAELVSYQRDGGLVTVRVRTSAGAQAEARAERRLE